MKVPSMRMMAISAGSVVALGLTAMRPVRP